MPAMTDISQQGADDADNVVAGDAPRWRNWLWLTLSLAAAGSIMLWLAVVLIDPFSTGRFALTQRIDMTTTNARLGDAALVRDPRFNGAIFGDSVAATLDPRSAAGHSNWRLASLAIYAAGASEV